MHRADGVATEPGRDGISRHAGAAHGDGLSAVAWRLLAASKGRRRCRPSAADSARPFLWPAIVGYYAITTMAFACWRARNCRRARPIISARANDFAGMIASGRSFERDMMVKASAFMYVALRPARHCPRRCLMTPRLDTMRQPLFECGNISHDGRKARSTRLSRAGHRRPRAAATRNLARPIRAECFYGRHFVPIFRHDTAGQLPLHSPGGAGHSIAGSRRRIGAGRHTPIPIASRRPPRAKPSVSLIAGMARPADKSHGSPIPRLMRCRRRVAFGCAMASSA